MQVVLDALVRAGNRYIMTYMDNLTFDQRWHTTLSVLSLQKLIIPHMTKFDGQSFLDWSRAHDYPETKMWHPLEAAHKSAAEYLIANHNLV
jgi:hypothetical protein